MGLIIQDCTPWHSQVVRSKLPVTAIYIKHLECVVPLLLELDDWNQVARHYNEVSQH